MKVSDSFIWYWIRYHCQYTGVYKFLSFLLGDGKFIFGMGLGLILATVILH